MDPGQLRGCRLQLVSVVLLRRGVSRTTWSRFLRRSVRQIAGFKELPPCPPIVPHTGSYPETDLRTSRAHQANLGDYFSVDLPGAFRFCGTQASPIPQTVALSFFGRALASCRDRFDFRASWISSVVNARAGDLLSTSIRPPDWTRSSNLSRISAKLASPIERFSASRISSRSSATAWL